MTREQAVLNRIWSQTLLEELNRLGVVDVCFAPGSRSTPLTLEADANDKLVLHPHFDERGLGFLALGLAKASQKPVAIIVTSGTAVANLLPAVAEAKLTGEKLVILAADRPKELIGCGANQCIEQEGIFSSHVCQALYLPSPTSSISLNWLLAAVDEAMMNQGQQGGAIHINCPFPEPLYSDLNKTHYADYLMTVEAWQSSQAPYTSYSVSTLPMQNENYASFYPWPTVAHKKGILVVGDVTLSEAKKAKQLANALGWPVLCDPQSGVSSDWAYFDVWLQNSTLKAHLNQSDLIIQFGGRIVSKRLNNWINEQVTKGKTDYVYVSAHLGRNNPAHLPQQHIVCDIETWIETLEYELNKHTIQYTHWAAPLKDAVHQLEQHMLVLSEDNILTEVAIALDLAERSQHADLFLGNSLIVRLVDMFASIKQQHTYSNRGASGIDGLVATAAGVQRIRQQPMLMLIGDTSLLYDLNSLALVTQTSAPLVIVVTNNNGGAIFDLLPVPSEQRVALYQMPHEYQFEFAAKQFKLNYNAPKTLTDYQYAVSDHLLYGKGTLIVEVITQPQQASEMVKRLVQCAKLIQ